MPMGAAVGGGGNSSSIFDITDKAAAQPQIWSVRIDGNELRNVVLSQARDATSAHKKEQRKRHRVAGRLLLSVIADC